MADADAFCTFAHVSLTGTFPSPAPFGTQATHAAFFGDPRARLNAVRRPSR
jgi:hypothetical protein